MEILYNILFQAVLKKSPMASSRKEEKVTFFEKPILDTALKINWCIQKVPNGPISETKLNFFSKAFKWIQRFDYIKKYEKNQHWLALFTGRRNLKLLRTTLDKTVLIHIMTWYKAPIPNFYISKSLLALETRYFSQIFVIMAVRPLWLKIS